MVNKKSRNRLEETNKLNKWVKTELNCTGAIDLMGIIPSLTRIPFLN